MHDAGYTEPTPIQAQAIPPLLEGHDLLGCAQTGTGKTAAFALPILQHLAQADRPARANTVRCLVLVPTRELAAQVAESFTTYGAGLKLSVALVHGGVGETPQIRALARGVDVLVACPGRLVDLMGRRLARLDAVEVLVLDEADHMLDLGFIPDVRRIVAQLPRKRQTLLFSATMPAPIQELANGLLVNPSKVFVTPPATTVEAVEQRLHYVESARKRSPARASSCATDDVERALVFTRTKHGANRVAEQLTKGGIHAEAIHGNKSQNARTRALEAFKRGQHAGAGRDRPRRARHRRGRHHARHQLRAARGARDLRAPDRPHRPRGRDRHRDLALCERRARAAARDRAPDPLQRAGGGRTSSGALGAQRTAGAPPAGAGLRLAPAGRRPRPTQRRAGAPTRAS